MKRAEISRAKAEAFLGVPLPDPAPVVEVVTRNKPPRKKKYMTPEEMFVHFQAYRVKEKASPFLVNNFIPGKLGAEEVHLEKERPLTMEGFEVYLMMEGITMSIKHILANQGGQYSAYSSIIEAIKTIIRHDQISGSMAGVFNANLTSRLNGLAEKTENKNLNINTTYELEMDLS